MNERFPSLDGLRGVAILMVTCLHLWQAGGSPEPAVWGCDLSWLVRYGTLGVPLFFAISGFCLYHPLAIGRAPAWANFYARRALRILPAYWLAVLVWLPLWATWSPEGSWVGWPRHLLTHLTFTHSLFPDTIRSVNGPLWSMGTEVHFYLAFPLLATLVRRWPLRTLLASFALSAAISYLAAARWDDYEMRALVGRTLPAQLSAFVAGMCAAHLAVRIKEGKPGRPRHGWLAYPLLPAILYLTSRSHPVGWGWTDALLAPAWLLLLLLAVSGCPRLLCWRPLTLCGVVSYSVYLHNRAMDLVPTVLFPSLTAGSPPWWVATFGVVITLGTLGYLLVERPFLAIRRKLRG